MDLSCSLHRGSAFDDRARKAVGGCPSALRCGGRRKRRPSDPAAPGRSVRRGYASSTRTLRCSQRAGEGRTRGPPAAVRFAKPAARSWRTPRAASVLLRKPLALGPRTDGARPDRLTAMGQPPGRCAPRRRRGASPAARPRLCRTTVVHHAKPWVGVRLRASAAARSAAAGGLPDRRKAIGSRAAVRAPSIGSLRSRLPPMRGVRQAEGFANRTAAGGPRVLPSPARCEHRRVRVDEAQPRLTDRPGAAGSLGRRLRRPPQRSADGHPPTALRARSSPARFVDACGSSLRVRRSEREQVESTAPARSQHARGVIESWFAVPLDSR